MSAGSRSGVYQFILIRLGFALRSLGNRVLLKLVGTWSQNLLSFLMPVAYMQLILLFPSEFPSSWTGTVLALLALGERRVTRTKVGGTTSTTLNTNLYL